MKNKAKKEQYYLELGAYFLRKGAVYKPGDPFNLPRKINGTVQYKMVWISNLYFDFAKNKITHQFSVKNPNILTKPKKQI